MKIRGCQLIPLEQTHHPLLVGLYREKVEDGIQGTVQVHEQHGHLEHKCRKDISEHKIHGSQINVGGNGKIRSGSPAATP